MEGSRNNRSLEGKPRAGVRGSEAYQKLMKAIEEFVAAHAPSPNSDLLEQMVYTVCRLSKDRTGRGELKILNRALKELRIAFNTFAPFANVRKVSIFGSARTPERHPQYQEARKFAELIQQTGWMVITGAGDGIMRAGHHGATREASFGVSISLPFEQSTNDVIEGDPKLVHFKYFFTRKLMFVKEANAIVLFPGGFGTQDEGFEALTLVQTGKSHLVPIVLCDEPGGTYWQHWRTYVKAELLGSGMISPQDMDLFFVTDRAEEAVRHIVEFYRRYHSMRYVEDELVLRLQSPISSQTLEAINRDYASVLSSGKFELHSGALDGERGELPDLWRLRGHFDRRSMGKLRKLVDFINRAP